MITTALLLSLAVLALIDSTSFGTLFIPIWLLMTDRRVRVDRFLIYLVTVAGLYFGTGLLLLFGAGAFLDRYSSFLNSDRFLLGQLVLGAALLVVSQLMDSKRARARAAERAARGEGRIFSWRNRIIGDSDGSQGSIVALVGLAFTAFILELGTMLPYLAATGLIAAQGLSWGMSGLVLLGYCIVMVLPALVLLIGRLLAYRALRQPLARLDQWFVKNAQSTTAWIIGIAGFLLAANAIYDLGWVG